MTIPATIVCAWVFFWFCERPFMNRKKAKATAGSQEVVELMITEPGEPLTA
jgi:peptidoglycan/LPS O-acetylase OafA/YrhL